MSNTWVPKDEDSQSANFNLFAPNTEDDLQEVLAKGSYKWTNKYTAVFAVVLVVVTSASAGIWYGHRSATSTTSISGFAGAAGFGRAARSGFTGTSGTAGAAGFAGGGFAGGGFGGSRISGTVTSVKGNTVIVTADSDPSSTVKAGDTVSVRVSAAGNSGSTTSPQAGTSPTGTSRTQRSQSSSGTVTSATQAPSAGASPAPGNGGRGGGFASNPEFAACLKKEGVTIVAGQRLDRSDPKVSAALQTCFSTLGGPGGPGGPGGIGGGARPSGAPTPAASATP